MNADQRRRADKIMQQIMRGKPADDAQVVIAVISLFVMAAAPVKTTEGFCKVIDTFADDIKATIKRAMAAQRAAPSGVLQ